MRYPTTLLILAALATPALAGPPKTGALHPESSERAAFKARLNEMMRLRQFDELERLAQSLISGDPRYSSGVSKLVDFYDALEPAGESGPDGADAREVTFTAWAQAKPASYWPQVGFSTVEVWRAWEARGTGSGRDLSKEQWDGFDRHMAAAMDWGRKALAGGARDPQLFTHMIGVCRDNDCSREEADRWLASALAINRNYDAAYIPMANALLPRWRGNSEDFITYADAASRENKTIGDIAYARIASVGLLAERNKFRETFPDLQWERIHRGLREIDKRSPDSASTYHLLARFAYAYQDREVARAAMARLGTEWDADAAQYWDDPILFGRARQWAMRSAVPNSP